MALTMERGVNLATSYFRTTYRSTIIGAAAFHFRVRNGNGWFHCARVTRGPATVVIGHLRTNKTTGDSGYHLGLPSREPTILTI